MRALPAFRALEDERLRLEPLCEAHRKGLVEAASDPEIWRFTPLMGGAPAAYVDLAFRVTAPDHQPYVLVDRESGGVIGMSRMFDIQPERGGLEIGYTWYVPSVWGTDVNPRAKLLLMTHAFETSLYERVMFKVDILNQRSQAAVLKLGAQREGVLRHERQRPDGTWRDTVVFSTLCEEWPQAKQGLMGRITAHTLLS